MNIFNLSPKFEMIRSVLVLLGIIEKQFTFATLFDGLMVYDLTFDDTYHEISIVCDLKDNDFLLEETFKELAEKYNIQYFSHRMLSTKINDDGTQDQYGTTTWTI